MGKITAILFFIVLAILITQFNKNMIIVLGIPLILVNLFVAAGISKNIEGNQNMNDTKKKDEAKKDEGQKKDSIKKKDDEINWPKYDEKQIEDSTRKSGIHKGYAEFLFYK